MSILRQSVKPEIFQAMMSLDVMSLKNHNYSAIRPILPCLVRMALCAPIDSSDTWMHKRKDILQILAGIEVVNSIVALLSIDFHALEQDVRKEQQLRSKLGGNPSGDSVLVSQLQHGIVLEFERSDPARRIRLLLSELLYVMAQIKDQKTETLMRQSEIFEAEVYLEEVSDVICIAQAELPLLIRMTDLVEALLCVKNGSWLLCRLVANSPDYFTEVCQCLIKNGDKQDEENESGCRRMQALEALCVMNPKESLNIRAMCVRHSTMPGVVVSITIQQSKDSKSDLLQFVSGLLLGNNQGTRSWFSQFVKAGQKRKQDPVNMMLHALRQELLQELKLLTTDDNKYLSQHQVIKASGFIRLYCALKGMATLKFTDEEIKFLLKLITSRPPVTTAGARFVAMALCMLIACPYLLGSPETEKEVIDWMKWLIEINKNLEVENKAHCSIGEMLFLIAIHFHGNQTHAIADLICNTLGMKSGVKANALSRIRQIFTQEIFTEQVITSHAIKVPVTSKLNADIQGYLPLHSIYQLLKSRAFSKHKVPIKDWIYRQICCSSVPIHPLLPSLIEVYVNSIIVRGAKLDFTNEPISEQEIMDVFQTSLFLSGDSGRSEIDQQNFAPQLLMLYYVLLYSDVLLTHMKTIVISNRKVLTYPENLLSQIPINFLVQEAQKEQQLYAGLFAPLLKLLVMQYPHLCLVEDWLEETFVKAEMKDSPIVKVSCTPESYKSAVDYITVCPSRLLLELQEMDRLHVQSLLLFKDVFVTSLPYFLKENTPRKLLDLVKKIWFKFHTVIPRSLRLATVNALRPQHSANVAMIPLTENDLTVDPLIVLRSDERVLRCPPILSVVLRLLDAYMQACRVHLNCHLQNNPVTDHTLQSTVDAERRELKNALISAQESAIVQILLECCLPKHLETDNPSEENNLREIQCLICPFLHKVFIADPNIAKLVHFQGYPSALLPITVAGIPSMHICLDFIPELISQPQLDKQVFGVELTSHLCSHYRLPKSMSIAKLVINVMFTLSGVLVEKECVDFFIQTLPSLIKITSAFPPLCEDVTSLLTQVGRICSTHISSSSCASLPEIWKDNLPEDEPLIKKLRLSCSSRYNILYKLIQMTFSDLVEKAVVTKNIYS